MSIKTFSIILNIALVALITSFGAICFEVLNGTSQANVTLALGFTVFFGGMLAVIKKIAQSCN